MSGLVPKKKPQDVPHAAVTPPEVAASASTAVVEPPPHAGGWIASGPKAATLVRCARHRDADASMKCDRCGQLWCKWCVKSGHEQAVKWTTCDCGGRCDPVVVEPAEAPRIDRSFIDAFMYPLRGEGKLLLVIGAVVFCAITFASGLFSGIFQLLFAGYQLSWMLRITRDTAQGKDSPPGFPEFETVFESMVVPMLKIFLIAGVTAGPGVALWCAGGSFVALGVVLTIAGLYVMPMALLAIAIAADSLEGFDVPRILRSIPRVGRTYPVVVLLFLATFALLVVGGPWIRQVFLIGPLAASVLGLYCIAVAGRVLGLLYAQHGKRLGWY